MRGTFVERTSQRRTTRAWLTRPVGNPSWTRTEINAAASDGDCYPERGPHREHRSATGHSCRELGRIAEGDVAMWDRAVGLLRNDEGR